MKTIEQIVPHMEKVEVFEMPSVIVIGRAKRNNEIKNSQISMGELWKECDSKDIFSKLSDLPRIIPNHCLGWTGDCPESDNPEHNFTYMIGVFVPMNTPIPDGFDYRVLHKNLVGKGLFGKDMPETIDELKSLGYEPNWDDNNGWNSELYLDGEPDNGFSWLIPVKPIKN
ncbi:MAG: GyrI-like domain-containing protein [Treponema sp.]|jgi:hypothetical protein|nr:GyrI-like domain-containing protein [Treponema sp.]